MENEEKLKEIFLNHDLFKQFRNAPENLQVVIREEGTLLLMLKNFPGLDTSILNNRAFNTLEIPEINLKQGHISSGGPDGVNIQYGYEYLPEKKSKIKP